MFKLLRNFINGLIFGTSLIIPGLSGGTLAIILGFYEQLLEAINNVTKDFRRYSSFIFPFGIGVVVGLVALASVIQFLLDVQFFLTMMFFIGLIIGIIPSIYKRAGGRPSLVEWPLIIIPIIILIVIAHLGDSGNDATYTTMSVPFMIFLFIIGIVVAASLLLPGLSGSFVLLMAGVYPLATYAVSSLRLVLAGNLDALMGIIMVLGPLGAGAIVGLFLMARLLERLFKNHGRAVFLVVVGLMIGSVYALLVAPQMWQANFNIPIGIVICAVGVILSYKMGANKNASI